VRRVAATTDDRALAALYAGALAVVAPSWLEGFGLPPVEAAAYGTPSVVSDLEIFAETLGDGALRVAPGDADALAAALVRLQAEATLRARLGAAARRAAARYDWTRSARALHAVLSGAAR
jgi:glycosyltransferase involved in cell wall biosynthesis